MSDINSLNDICLFNTVEDVKISQIVVCLFVLSILSFIAATLHLCRVHIKKMTRNENRENIQTSKIFKFPNLKTATV